MIDRDRAPVIVIERCARRAVRAPVRVLDSARMVVVIVIVIVMRGQVDVRRRKQRGEYSRPHEDHSGGAALAAGDHGEILP